MGVICRVIAASLLFLTTASGAGETFTHPQAGEIASALRDMMKQEEDRFVIVGIESSDNFFQYLSDGESRYVFDVPVVSLSQDQLRKALAFFESQGVAPALLSDEAGAEQDPANFTFERDLPHEQVDEGVRLGLEFLNEVLGYGDRALTVQRGWQ